MLTVYKHLLDVFLYISAVIYIQYITGRKRNCCYPIYILTSLLGALPPSVIVTLVLLTSAKLAMN